MRVAVIVNPAAGSRRRARRGADRAVDADRFLRELGAEPDVRLTEAAGHARELTHRALDVGADVVVAWGGDGTVNEVASALAHTGVPLGIVPCGSGNGLAKELGVPRQPRLALARAVGASPRSIDAGEIGGRFFANVAGLGLDARIARRFNALRGRTHGLASYVTGALAELWSFSPAAYSIDLRGERLDTTAMLVVFANSAQYGNRARIAPDARPDDGRLDLVIVEGGGVAGSLWRARRLFDGSLLRDRRVSHRLVERATVSAAGPITFHVDGEPVEGARRLDVRVLPSALLVKA
jgi:YegS/Rv2252/BmrU family lipid kinase